MRIVKIVKGDLSSPLSNIIRKVSETGFDPSNTGTKSFATGDAVLVLNTRGNRARIVQRGGGVITRPWTDRRITMADLNTLFPMGVTFTPSVRESTEYKAFTGIKETRVTTTSENAVNAGAGTTPATTAVASQTPVTRARRAWAVGHTTAVTTQAVRRHNSRGSDGRFASKSATSSS